MQRLFQLCKESFFAYKSFLSLTSVVYSYYPNDVAGACISSQEVRVEGAELKFRHGTAGSDEEWSFLRQEGGIM